jgi:hypothetical protein|tara:strand:+ start:256 stop:471 length:216 start_codon:yes stop_codon:yes gene_type:complete
MKPSEKIKALGFKSILEAANAAGEPSKNLIRWSKTYPRRFELILKGLVFERMNDQLNEIFDGIEEDEEGFE